MLFTKCNFSSFEKRLLQVQLEHNHMATKRSSSAKENKQPIDPVPDADLDDFVAKPGPSEKARFAKPLSEMQMTDLEKGPVVPNTEKSTAWALRTFNDWHNERNKQSATGDICPLDLLKKPEAEKLNFWLSRFIVEVRRKDGEPYPARTLIASWSTSIWAL